VGKERNGTERHTSPFRETVAIVAASVTSEIAINRRPIFGPQQALLLSCIEYVF
jgi:hypothetical protein